MEFTDYFSSFSFYDENYTIPGPPFDMPILSHINRGLCIVGLIFNIIVIAICHKLCAYGSARVLVCGRAYFFVMWLCVCNSFFLTYRTIFRQWIIRSNNQISKEIPCKLYNSFEVIVQGFAVFTLVALSLDRYVVVRNPRRGSTVVIKYRYIILIFILILSVAASIPILIFGEINVHGVCEYMPRFSPYSLAYEISRTIIMYVLPLFLISVFYIEMAMILYRSRNSSACQNSTNRKERTQQRNRLALSVLLITIIFGVCHLPINLGMILQERFRHVDLGICLSNFGRPMVYINACTHPIVVLVINRAVRNEIRRSLGVFRKLPGRRNNQTTVDSVSRIERNTQTYALYVTMNDMNSSK